MKSSILISRGQVQSPFVYISSIDFYDLEEYDVDVVYVVGENRIGMHATSSNEAVQLWGEKEPFEPFTMKINASDSSFTIPTNGTGYDYTVDWGDGVVEAGVGDGDKSHTYASNGQYTIKIYGHFPRIYFNNSADNGKLLDIISWGQIVWESMVSAFQNCTNTQVSATDAPVLTEVKQLDSAFRSCTSITSLDFSGWDVSGIISTSYMFYFASSLGSLNLTGWNTENITNMREMFRGIGGPPTGIEGFNYEKVDNLTNYLFGVTMTTGQYDSLLCNISVQSLKPSVNAHFGYSKYSTTGDGCRTSIINTHGWTIADGGLAP